MEAGEAGEAEAEEETAGASSAAGGGTRTGDAETVESGASPLGGEARCSAAAVSRCEQRARAVSRSPSHLQQTDGDDTAASQAVGRTSRAGRRG